jgi:uncharacterized protein (UPF0303 family)
MNADPSGGRRPAAQPAGAPTSAPHPEAPRPAGGGMDDALVQELVALEELLVLPRFKHTDAWSLGSMLVEMAHLREAPVTIDIRRNGQQLFHAALPGSSMADDDWTDRKRRVVERYGESSLLVAARHRAHGTTFEAAAGLDPARYAARGGSLPIEVEGAGVIGSLTVSGLGEAGDHEMAVDALRRLVGSLRSPTGV